MVDNTRSRERRIGLASIFPFLLLLAGIQIVDGIAAVYDGGAGCKGYGFHMNAVWLDCDGGLCALEDGAMRVQGTFSTEYMMPWAYYTLKIKACKWYGMRCVDVGSEFEVDLCETFDCRIGNHTVDQEIIFYGEEEDQYDYWVSKYGYGTDATEDEINEYYQNRYKQQDEVEVENTEAPSAAPSYNESDYRYGKSRNHNYFRNKYAWKRQQRQQQYEEKYPERTIAKDLSEFASAGTVVTISFTFIPYTEASYDMKWGWNTNMTAQGYYHQKYGKQYRYDNLVCSLPLKIVSDDFDIELWQKSSRYRARLRTYQNATTMTTVAIVGLLGLSAWGMKRRRLVCNPSACGCLGDATDEDNSIREDDSKATNFVLDESDSHSVTKV